MEITTINKDNTKDYIGKQVEVEICCYAFGMMYPDDNYLESFDEYLDEIEVSKRSKYIEKLIREDMEKRGKDVSIDF